MLSRTFQRIKSAMRTTNLLRPAKNLRRAVVTDLPHLLLGLRAVGLALSLLVLHLQLARMLLLGRHDAALLLAVSLAKYVIVFSAASEIRGRVWTAGQ